MSLPIVVRRVASTRVVALRQIVADYQSQGPLWGRTMQFAAANNLLPCPQDGEAKANFAIFHDVGFKQSDVDTEVCVPIEKQDADIKAAGDFQIYDVPELPRAASVTHKGPYKGLTDVYGQLFGWIAMQGETIAGPVREVYHVSMMNSPDQHEDELVTEILVPLK